MVAGKVGAGPATFHPKLLGESHTLVAARASGACQILRGDRRVRVEMRFDGVNAMAIGADRGLRVAAGEGLPVNAPHEFQLHGLMTLATGERDIELEDGGLLVAGAANFVDTVAISADGGPGGSAENGTTVHALLVGIELLRGLAGALHH